MANVTTPTLANFHFAEAQGTNFQLTNPAVQHSPTTPVRTHSFVATTPAATLRMAVSGRQVKSETPTTTPDLLLDTRTRGGALLSQANQLVIQGDRARNVGNYNLAYNQYHRAGGLFNGAMAVAHHHPVSNAQLLAMGGLGMRIDHAVHTLPQSFTATRSFAPIF